MLNRQIAPESNAVQGIHLRPLSHFVLDNGIPVYYLHTPNTGVMKIDFILNGGIRNQVSVAQAVATGSLLTEGTHLYTAKQLADQLDTYGAYVQSKTTVDDSQLSLFCLPRHLGSIIPYIVDILTNCSFPQEELDTYKRNAIQRLLVNSQRNSYLASRTFYPALFGNENPIGSTVNQIDYENISRETVRSFYSNNISGQIKYILVSGDVDTTTLACLQEYLGSIPTVQSTQKSVKIVRQQPRKLRIENPYSVQSTIKIGRPWVTRSHPDFIKLQVLNLVLGGYFGSRLMRNIREEKGLTYGIYSSVETYKEIGVFYIETEINNKLREQGIEEIGKELGKLRDRLIPSEELLLVKNYMLGSFLRGIDGPFSLIDRYKMIIDFGFSYEYFNNFVDTITEISSVELLDLANQYLTEESMTTVVVGNK